MHRRFFTRALLLLAAAALIFPPSALAEGDRTLTGQFVWERSEKDISGDLKAVFTPTGENTWNVVFYFDWDDEARTWKGSAEGSLDDGELKGQGLEDRDRKRTFTFSGNVKEGVFEGTHGRERDGEFRKAGTLRLELK